LFQSGSNSTSTGSSGSVSGSGGKKPFFLHPPNEAQGEQPQLTGNGKNNVCGQQLPPDISSGHKILAGADRANQGNLLRGIDNSFSKVLSFLEAWFDLISGSLLHMKIQKMVGKITENLGLKFPLRKVEFILSFFSFHFQFLHKKLHIFVFNHF
jgi:hypothetical protein